MAIFRTGVYNMDNNHIDVADLRSIPDILLIMADLDTSHSAMPIRVFLWFFKMVVDILRFMLTLETRVIKQI